MSDTKKIMFSVEYIREVLMKIIDNLLSVKVWVIIGVLSLSAKMVYDGQLTGGEFTTLNTTLTAIAVGMREVFKVNKIRAMATNASKTISDMKE